MPSVARTAKQRYPVVSMNHKLCKSMQLKHIWAQPLVVRQFVILKAETRRWCCWTWGMQDWSVCRRRRTFLI